MADPFQLRGQELYLLRSDVCKEYKKAQHLWLWYNKLSFLPDNFTKLTRLQELYLDHNSFTNFPHILCGMTKLKILDLSNNCLASIPSEVRGMRLERLVLSNNQLREFPSGVTEMPGLERLWLGWNQISSLPEDIGMMKTLKILKLNNNELESIPDEICELSELDEADFDCNPLGKISPSVSTFLQSISLASFHGNQVGNHLNSITVNVTNHPDNEVRKSISPVSMFVEEKMKSSAPVTTETIGDDNDLYDCYKMDTDPLGIAVVISNQKFECDPNNPNSHKLDSRHGTEVDVGKLKAVFEKLHFNVLIWNNLSSRKMVQVMESVGSMDHSQYSCLVVCILSHGAQGEVAGSDGVTVSIQRLAKPFTAEYCMGLIRKPKLFFIQACQGGQQQQGVPMPYPTPTNSQCVSKPGVSDAVPSEGVAVQETCAVGQATSHSNINASRLPQPARVVVAFSRFRSQNATIPRIGQNATPRIEPSTSNQSGLSQTSNSITSMSALPNNVAVVPNGADFLYGFSTAPGYEAYRYKDGTKGSWYINKLTEVLEREAGRKHLLEILTLVNNEVAKEGNLNFKQIPAPQYTLTKKLYFRYN